MKHVTFDTNTFEPVGRPERALRSPHHGTYQRLNAAIQSGALHGYFSETIVTLEGIERKDRAAVLSSSRSVVSESIREPQDNLTIVDVAIEFKQVKRKPLHPEMGRRVMAGYQLGMRALRAPRSGGITITNAPEDFYAVDIDKTRIDRFLAIVRAIEARKIGIFQIKELAHSFATRAGTVGEPWVKSLVHARDVHEINEVSRAVAEWADGEAIAAHLAYDLDYFCTMDKAGGTAGMASVLDAENRAWLEQAYSVQFVTPSELVELI